jgi:UDP-N-acetylglucosamine 1-carboxyvinyltransferase
MKNMYLQVEQSLAMSGQAQLVGAKNAVLVIMASLVLAPGKSRLTNVPASADVLHMIKLLKQLGAQVTFIPENHVLEIDASRVTKWRVSPEIMKKMRASILIMGPLLARFGRAEIALPGGCVLGARPIDYHLTNFAKMGVEITIQEDFLYAQVQHLQAKKMILAYPSVGATENILMAAVLTPGCTRIINAALEPEVFNLIAVLQKMGAHITIVPPATIEIEGVKELQPVEYAIIPDRLEAGALLLAAAITGGDIWIPDAPAYALDVFLLKLEEMGHTIEIGHNDIGVRLKATQSPKSVSFKTGPYPSFPTDLQAPMMAAQCLAQGTSIIEETVFENRLLHVRELEKMGAQIKIDGNKATIMGVEELYGSCVIATDIRASCALVLAGLAARGTTIMTGVQHWKRGYENLDKKLTELGAHVALKIGDPADSLVYKTPLVQQVQVN